MKKKAYISLIFTLTGLLIPVLIIGFVAVNWKNSQKMENPKTLKEVKYSIPFILDSKAVLKAKYINLTNYQPYQLAICLASNLTKCKNDNILITAYIYKNANKEFCEKIKNGLKVKNIEIKDPESLKNAEIICNLFYKMKTNNLTEKDCIGKYQTEFCSYYLENHYDFIKANLQFLNLLSRPEEVNNCLNLEEPAAYYCLKLKKVNCSQFEDPREVKKCYDLLVIPNKSYQEILNKVWNYLQKNNWKGIEAMLKNTTDPNLIHSFARLGALNGEFCKNFLNKSLKQYKYCLKRYYNQRFLCQYSPDKKQCIFFDVLLNNKSCELLKDPQEKSDCELFKKYINKKDCNFFYTVGSNEYLGYLCAIYKKNCSGQFYYDKMYQLVCKKWVENESN